MVERDRGSGGLLNLLTPIAAASALACLALALATPNWLYTEEQIRNRNRTVKFGPGSQPEFLGKRTSSGLWLLCYTQPGGGNFSCRGIDYFPTETYRPDPQDSTGAIPYTAARSCLYFLPCGLLLLVATYCCLAGILTDRGKLFTFVAGVAFVLGGLIILMGLVVYISTFKAEVGHKLRPKSDLDPAPFSYSYGFSFHTLIASFLCSEVAGICSIFQYLAHHQKMWEAHEAEYKSQQASIDEPSHPGCQVHTISVTKSNGHLPSVIQCVKTEEQMERREKDEEDEDEEEEEEDDDDSSISYRPSIPIGCPCSLPIQPCYPVVNNVLPNGNNTLSNGNGIIRASISASSQLLGTRSSLNSLPSMATDSSTVVSPSWDTRATSTWDAAAAARSKSPTWEVPESRTRAGRHISIDDIPVTHTYLQDSGEESDTPSTLEESSSSRASGDSSSSSSQGARVGSRALLPVSALHKPSNGHNQQQQHNQHQHQQPSVQEQQDQLARIVQQKRENCAAVVQQKREKFLQQNSLQRDAEDHIYGFTEQVSRV